MAASRAGRRALQILLFLVCLGLISVFVCLHVMGPYLVHAEQPQKSDIVLVLAGDWSGQRILTGAELVRQGYAPRIWVSGPMDLYGVNEATLAINYAAAHGYPKSMFEPKSLPASSTRAEAKAFQKEFDSANVHRILLVTSNYHTRRAGSVFRSVLGNRYQLSVVAAPNALYHPYEWWRYREDRKTFFFEWTKTIAEGIGL